MLEDGGFGHPLRVGGSRTAPTSRPLRGAKGRSAIAGPIQPLRDAVSISRWLKGGGGGCIFVAGFPACAGIMTAVCGHGVGLRDACWFGGPHCRPVHPHRDPLLISPWKGEGDDSRERV